MQQEEERCVNAWFFPDFMVKLGASGNLLACQQLCRLW